MKRLLLTILFIWPLALWLNAQRSYRTTDSEMIFSFAEINRAGIPLENNMRWTVFYHTATYNNNDLTNNFGLFYGLALRNIGLITADETVGGVFYSTIKRRSYSLGIPVGIKIGDIGRNQFLFGGGEYELLFHYKEKRFSGNDKIYKERAWFSNQTNRLIPSLFLGINMKSQITVTFKYYLNDFMNRSYEQPGTGLQPYSEMDSKLFYISISKRFKYNRLKDLTPEYILSI